MPNSAKRAHDKQMKKMDKKNKNKANNKLRLKQKK